MEKIYLTGDKAYDCFDAYLKDKVKGEYSLYIMRDGFNMDFTYPIETTAEEISADLKNADINISTSEVDDIMEKISDTEKVIEVGETDIYHILGKSLSKKITQFYSICLEGDETSEKLIEEGYDLDDISELNTNSPDWREHSDNSKRIVLVTE